MNNLEKLIFKINQQQTVFKIEHEQITDSLILTISVNKTDKEDLKKLLKKIRKNYQCENLTGTNEPTSPVFGQNTNLATYSLIFHSQKEIEKVIKFIGTHC